MNKKIICTIFFLLFSFSTFATTKISRKPFEKQEDEILIKAVQEHGKDWDKIANLVPNRTKRQCRERYENYLDPSITFRKWTPLEDYFILNSVKKYGKKWKMISLSLSGRTPSGIKNRFYKIIRKEQNDCIGLSKISMKPSNIGQSSCSNNSRTINPQIKLDNTIDAKPNDQYDLIDIEFALSPEIEKEPEQTQLPTFDLDFIPYPEIEKEPEQTQLPTLNLKPYENQSCKDIENTETDFESLI